MPSPSPPDRLQAIIERDFPPDQTLRAALRDLVDIGSDPINRSTLMTGRPLSLAPASHRRLCIADREYESRFQAILEQGIEAGIFVPRDPRFLMYTLIIADEHRASSFAAPAAMTRRSSPMTSRRCS